MIKVRCKNCNSELESHNSRIKCCGCSNMTTINGEKITGIDLSLVELITTNQTKNNSSVFSKEDLAYQEARRNRKIRKLNFEVK